MSTIEDVMRLEAVLAAQELMLEEAGALLAAAEAAPALGRFVGWVQRRALAGARDRQTQGRVLVDATRTRLESARRTLLASELSAVDYDLDRWEELLRDRPAAALARYRAVVLGLMQSESAAPQDATEQRAWEIDELTRAYDPTATRCLRHLATAFELARRGVLRSDDVPAVTARARELLAEQCTIPAEFADYVGEQVALALLDRA